MAKSNPKQTTLRDLAAAAGVSINTVSRALRGKEDIAEKTRERIKKLAAQMGYINNMIASSLRLGYTNTIAVLVGDISNPYFAVMMKEIEERARFLGYSSFLINTGENDDIERQAILSALNKNVDGIIICPAQQKDDNIKYLKKHGPPFVLIGRRFHNIATDYVVCDDELGGYLATRSLIERGHRKIMMINGPTHISSARERLAGYRRAMREAGRRPLVREVGLAGEGCEALVDELATGRPRVSAVFAFSDLLAWKFWAALSNRGLTVPDDYSLIGFDHIQSRLPVPGRLSSVSSYKGNMSVAAVDLLVARIRGENRKTTRLIIPAKLAAGDTVADAHQG